MNIKRIIQEEIDDFGWMDEILENPLKFIEPELTLDNVERDTDDWPIQDGNGEGEVWLDVSNYSADEKGVIIKNVENLLGGLHWDNEMEYCFTDKIKAYLIHCGHEENHFFAQENHICCMDVDYDTFIYYEEQEYPHKQISDRPRVDGGIFLYLEMNESNVDDFGWADDIPTFDGGKKFNQEDICTDVGDECRVTITDDEIIFRINTQDLSDDWGYGDWYITELFNQVIYGDLFDGGGDYYEFDNDEFNYTGYLSDGMQENIVNFMMRVDEDLRPSDIESWFDDSMYSFENHLKYPTLLNYFNNLVSEVLTILGYQIQKNRWLSASRFFYENLQTIRGKGVQLDIDEDDVILTVPNKVFDEIHREKNITDLTSLFADIMEPVLEYSWDEVFYDEWDTSGVHDEIESEWVNFLNLGNDYLKNPKYIEEREFVDYVYNKLESDGWGIRGGDVITFTKLDPNNVGRQFNLKIQTMNPSIVKGHGMSGKVWPNTGNSWRDGKEIAIKPSGDESKQDIFNAFMEDVNSIINNFQK